VWLASTGAFAEADLGVACYHSKVGAVELILNHLVAADDEYVVVDMTAGADAFASGLFTRFDRTFVVCEPTLRSVGVWRQYRDYAAEHEVALSVVGNKVCGAPDHAFLRGRVGSHLLSCLGVSDYVRAAEQGRLGPIGELEAAGRVGGRLPRVGRRRLGDFRYGRATAGMTDRATGDVTDSALMGAWSVAVRRVGDDPLGPVGRHLH
jgi:CO dehydrogenase maturation factor